MKNLLLLSVICLVFASCAPKIDESLTSGIRGQVFIGPMCPVMQEGVPCPDQPYQAKLTILGREGRAVVKVTTDAEGNFEIKLPPGDYVLHAENLEGGKLPFAQDMEFTVKPNEFTEIDFYFDSGIR
jgi:hypothetical protein